jgi:L-rhamnose isomerase
LGHPKIQIVHRLVMTKAFIQVSQFQGNFHASKLKFARGDFDLASRSPKSLHIFLIFLLFFLRSGVAGALGSAFIDGASGTT